MHLYLKKSYSRNVRYLLYMTLSLNRIVLRISLRGVFEYKKIQIFIFDDISNIYITLKYQKQF